MVQTLMPVSPNVRRSCVGGDLLSGLQWLADQNIWKFGKKSTTNSVNHFWSCTAYNRDLTPDYTFEQAMQERPAFASVSEVVESLRPEVIGDDLIERVYLNAQTMGLDGGVHHDVPPPTPRRTTLIYCHPEWEESWGGELEFLDAKTSPPNEIISPSPGLVVNFNAGAWHRARAPNCPEAGLRVVLVVKSAPRGTPFDASVGEG